MLRIAVIQNKGGVGRTTCTLCLGLHINHQHGRPVTYIDMDPQHNLSTTALPDDFEWEKEPNVFDVFWQEGALAGALAPTRWDGITVVPGAKRLREYEESRKSLTEQRLRDAFGIEQDWPHDGVIIADCPPSLGPLTEMATVWADVILYVTVCSLYGVDGIVEARELVQRTQHYYNSSLKEGGILINRWDPDSWDMSRAREQEIRDAFGELVLPGQVKESANMYNIAEKGDYFKHNMWGAPALRNQWTGYADHLLTFEKGK